jgi:integrase/recombinase XerD
MSLDISVKSFTEYIRTVSSPATAKKYGVGADKFLAYLQARGLRDFGTLPRNTLQQYTASLIEHGYLPNTVKLYTVAVERYLVWCADQGLVLPTFAKPHKPKALMRVKSILNQADIVRFFTACNNELDEPLRTAVMLMPCCGLRANEMASLPLSAIQKVSLKLQDGTSKTCLSLRVVGKGNKERFVPLLDEGAQILTSYLKGWRREAKGPHLFPSRLKKGENPITANTLWRAVTKLRDVLDIVMSPHTFRRTYATYLWKRKVADTTISKILGHEKLETLYKHYLNVNAEDLSKAVQDQGGRLLGP